MEHWAKNFRKNRPKTRSKHVWMFLWTILGIFGILKIFFLKIFENSTIHGTLGKSFSEKLPQNRFRTRLDTFGNDFRLFWNFENFWYFFENFRRLDPPWKTGQKFFEKFAPKHVPNTFGYFVNDFGPFWNFKHFLIFLKIFEDSTFHGKMGKNFSKNMPQNMFQTLLDSLGNGFVRFWLEFWKFFEFLWKVSKTRHSMENWAKIFRKICPKTCSKHVWILLGTILGIFGILKFFWFFWKFLKTRPSMEHWAKNFRKNRPKTRSKHVWIFLWTILGIFGILKIFFLKIFENSTIHGTLGESFSEKLPQNTFRTRLDTFGNDFRLFWNFENFWYFFENFRRLDPPWKTGQKFFEKFAPKHVPNTFGYFWERFWAFLEF